MRKHALWVLAMVLFCAGALAAAADDVRGQFDRTLNVSGPVDLGVETGSGAITVRSGDTGKVTIHGDIRARGSDAEQRVKQIEANPPIQQNGNTIRIRKPDESGGGGWLNFGDYGLSISYVITVPADTRLDAHSGSGSAQISDIKGPVTARTGSGSMRVSGIAGEVQAETGSGSMNLQDLRGNVRGHTGSGSIKADNLGSGNARINLETGSGSLEVRRVRGALYAHTGSGHITADGEPTGGWNLHTGSGGMDVRVPANAAFDVKAHTGSGGITVDHPITIQGNISKHSLEGKVRGGGPLLELGTGSGGIRISAGGGGAAL